MTDEHANAADPRELLRRIVACDARDHANPAAYYRAMHKLVEAARAYLASPDARSQTPPRVPTLEMAQAGARSLIDGQEQRPGSSWADEAALAWQAMYDAAPSAPPTQEPTRDAG